MDIVGDSDAADDINAIIEALQGTEIGATIARKRAQRGKDKVDASKLPVGFAGLTPTSIIAGATGNVTAPLNVNMRIDRIVLGAAACVALSRVTQVAIGSINLLVGTQAIPCEVFSNVAVATSIKAAVTATPSVPPVFTFSNGTAGAVVYEGAIIGPVVRD